MRRIEGSEGVELIECVNPIRDKWRIRWDVQKQDNGNVNYMEAEFNHKPSDSEIRDTVFGWINRRTEDKILTGLIYDGHMVWLSSENQFNYKALYDLAHQSKGISLPVTVKLGTDEEPHYMEIDSMAKMGDFYMAALYHVRRTLEEGWKMKDEFSIDDYHKS